MSKEPLTAVTGLIPRLVAARNRAAIAVSETFSTAGTMQTTTKAAASQERTLPALTEGKLQQVTILPPANLDTVEAIRCYQGIERMLGTRTQSVVQIVSPAMSSTNLYYAHVMAWAAAARLGRRVLLIHVEPPGSALALPKERQRAKSVSGPNPFTRWPVIERLAKLKPLSDLIRGDATAEEALVKEANSKLYLGALQFDTIGDNPAASTNAIGNVLERLRRHFDMILIAPPSAADEPSAAILSGMVDGTVLVMEALMARRRPMRRAVQALQSGGAPILGIIFSGERNYLPKWLRWLQPE